VTDNPDLWDLYKLTASMTLELRGMPALLEVRE
jgi:hypothetical protein